MGIPDSAKEPAAAPASAVPAKAAAQQASGANDDRIVEIMVYLHEVLPD
jgi:hypothetical protein